MSCIAIFKVGDKEISLDLETGPDSPLTDQEILEILTKNPEKRQELCSLIQNKLYKQNTIEPIKVSDLTSLSGLKGNTDVEFLANEFPEVSFPQGINANVLLVNNLKVGNQSIYGRVINSNGEELFVIRGNNNDVQKLANFLFIRKQMQDQSFIFNEDSAYQKDLESCLKERNKRKPALDTTFDLILDFIYNRKKYDNLYFTNSKGQQESVYAYLSKINNIILQYSDRVVFSDQFVNTINQIRQHLDNNDGFVSYTALYNAIKQYHNEILEQLDIKSQKEFKDFFDSKDESPELSAIFPYVEGQSRYEQLLSGLFKAEPEFSWSYSRATNKGIILHSSPKTIQAKYGIEYDTIHSFDIIQDDFLGYKIYRFTDEDGNQKYVSSRGYLTEQSIAKVYTSLDELKQYIQNSVSKQDIKKNSLIEFKYREQLEEGWSTELDSFQVRSLQSLVPGSIIESIDVPVNEKQEFYNSDENNLFKLDRQNYDTFTRIVRGWNISDELKNNIIGNINTPEKIAIFVYKANELLKNDRSNEQVLTEILEMVQNAKKNYYYIDSKQSSDRGFKYRVIPTNPVQIDNYKKDKRVPVIELMSAIGQVLQSQFGVNINMLTSSEIVEKYPDIDVNTTKAFVRDSEIFINTTLAEVTDPLHEFTHIILGVLKANPELSKNYEQLMYIVSKTEEGKRKIQKLRDIYTEASEMDLMEEAFVDLFSRHIMGELKPGFDNLFTSVDKYMKDATKIVFNNPIEDLGSFYGSSIQTVFRRFNSDIASLLDGRKIDFAETRQSRRISNWISKQIKEGNIKEECYG